MDDNDYVLAFDHFYTNNHIQILKSLLPFIEDDSISNLPVLIKYLELQHTISLCNESKYHLSEGISACSKNSQKKDIGDNLENIYNAIHQYLAPDEDKNISQIISAFQTMKNVREMQQMMEMFQSLNTDNDFDIGLNSLGNLGNINYNNMDMSDLLQLINNLK